MGLLVGLTIGGGYCSILNQFFIWDQLEGGFILYNIPRHSLPLIFMLLDSKMSYSTGVYCFIDVIDICGCLFSLGLLVLHWNLIKNNQTINERNKGIKVYDLGNWRENVVQVLGENILKGLLFPFSSSTLEGNGVTFITRDQHQLIGRKHK
jgi:hypothetical protein